MVWSQRSYEREEGGVLYVVPTPIGNLEDITLRAINVLKSVDYIACEDTRQTLKLLNHFQIKQKLTAYHEHNKHKKGPHLLADLKQGKRIALVSDAGMPAIADPGEDLVRLAVEARIPVISLPGANAALTGLVASGLSTRNFVFYGFLSRKASDRREELEQLSALPYTLIFYVSPHHLDETLKDMRDILGERQAALIKEISKRHEQYVRGSLSDLVSWVDKEDVRGEYMVVVEPQIGSGQNLAECSDWWHPLKLTEHVEHYLNQGLLPNEAIKRTAQDRHLSKRQVYQLYHGLRKRDDAE